MKKGSWKILKFLFLVIFFVLPSHAWSWKRKTGNLRKRSKHFKRPKKSNVPTKSNNHLGSYNVPTNSDNRQGSYPVICGDTFRGFCDHILDETDVSFDPNAVRRGDTIFIKFEFLKDFFNFYHPAIKHPYIIITHNSDHKVPGKYASYLNDPKVFAWFGQNIDRRHPKLKPIPLGIANPHFHNGNVKILNCESSELESLERRQEKKLVYANFRVHTNRRARIPVRDILSRKSFVFLPPDNRTFEEYLKEMKTYRFVASPLGNGMDCYRTWEALLMGCIPIVQESTIDALWGDLPVIVVKDWNVIDRNWLQEKYNDLRMRTFKFEKLHADYWFDLIRLSQSVCRKN